MKKTLFMFVVFSLLSMQFSFSTYGATKYLEETIMVVNVSILNLRSTQEISTNIIRKLKLNEELTVLSMNGDWYLVSTKDEQKGYVWGKYLSKPNNYVEVPSQNISNIQEENITNVRQELITYAKQFLGRPYVFGGTSLTNGVDCSSFTQQMMAKFGYKLHRTSWLQINDGKKISLEELLPGDLVFSGYSGIVSHVGIYIGNGNIIHASSPKNGITISGIFSKGRKPYIGSTRIIPE